MNFLKHAFALVLLIVIFVSTAESQVLSSSRAVDGLSPGMSMKEVVALQGEPVSKKVDTFDSSEHYVFRSGTTAVFTTSGNLHRVEGSKFSLNGVTIPIVGESTIQVHASMKTRADLTQMGERGTQVWAFKKGLGEKRQQVLFIRFNSTGKAIKLWLGYL